MKKAFIFDIDGTLADASHRLHFIEGPSKNWEAFFDAMKDDKVIEPVRVVYGILQILLNITSSFDMDLGFEIVFCTGRPDSHKLETIEWLGKEVCGPNGYRVYMRKTGDRRPDDVVKEEMIQRMRNEGLEPYVVFEDRKRCVDMWRRNGITCFQVADGDF